MAGISCERERLTGNANERAIARDGLSERFRSCRDNMQNLEQYDGSEKNKGHPTTDAIV